MVIGVPVFAFIYQLIREWVLDRLEEQKLQTQKKSKQPQALIHILKKEQQELL